jgi:4-aminobutyrate aminotransferase-like enzyme/Ser/Thr protein kinase RdoA (MazF antagonist)
MPHAPSQPHDVDRFITDLRAALAVHYALDSEHFDRLGGELGHLFASSVDGVRRHVVRLSDPATAVHLEFQARLLRHLRQAQLGVALPVLQSTLGGAPFIVEQIDGHPHLITVTNWVPGDVLATLPRPPAGLLRQLGRLAAALTSALHPFEDPDADRSHDWDLRNAPELIDTGLTSVSDARHRALAEQAVRWFHQSAEPLLASLPTSITHHDLNDYNVLVTRSDTDGSWQLTGLLDVGDALRTVRVAELAIAVAYASLRQPRPLAATRCVVEGYCESASPSAEELRALMPLAVSRLALNAVTWTHRQATGGADGYAADRMRDTWPALERLLSSGFDHAHATVRVAAGLQPDPRHDAVTQWVATLAANRRPLIAAPTANAIDADLDTAAHTPTNLPVGELTFRRYGGAIAAREARRSDGADEPDTLNLGVDVFVSPGTAVFAPYDAVISRVDTGTGELLLRHAFGAGPTFWTSYGGIEPTLVAGDSVSAGARLGSAARSVTDQGTSVVHVQLSCHSDEAGFPPTTAPPSERDVWLSRYPDPTTLVAGIMTPTNRFDVALGLRNHHVARSQRAYYQRPMTLVRGEDVWLTDTDGYRYLDTINNVSHVGHGHPRIIDTASRQMRRLNTNSRFVYPQLGQYAERLTGLLPDHLDVVFFTCSGSEANDLALRIARTVTGRSDVAVIDGAYHGNTTAVTGISPNRYRGPGGGAPPPTTHELVQPDRYRGRYTYDHPDPGRAYAEDAVSTLRGLASCGTPIAVLFAESLMGTAGQIVYPPGFLQTIVAEVHRLGGLYVADEVQVGFGRLGHSFWGFQRHDVLPDIVTMGKPIGNGHPMAAVVTTRAIADNFDNGMKYFNTFAGNPVSCAIGNAVLDVIADQHLQDNALDVGAYTEMRLRQLALEHDLIGDVRGDGLYLGVDLVVDRDTKAPAPAHAKAICEELRDHGIISWPNGTHDNVLKFKPPMTFTRSHADLFVEHLDQVLRRGW